MARNSRSVCDLRSVESPFSLYYTHYARPQWHLFGPPRKIGFTLRPPPHNPKIDDTWPAQVKRPITSRRMGADPGTRPLGKVFQCLFHIGRSSSSPGTWIGVPPSFLDPLPGSVRSRKCVLLLGKYYCGRCQRDFFHSVPLLPSTAKRERAEREARLVSPGHGRQW